MPLDGTALQTLPQHSVNTNTLLGFVLIHSAQSSMSILKFILLTTHFVSGLNDFHRVSMNMDMDMPVSNFLILKLGLFIFCLSILSIPISYVKRKGWLMFTGPEPSLNPSVSDTTQFLSKVNVKLNMQVTHGLVNQSDVCRFCGRENTMCKHRTYSDWDFPN